MANNDYPILNGIVPSYADIIVRASPAGAALIEMKDIAACNRSRTVEVGVQKGASGGRDMQRTTGVGGQEFTWTLYRTGYQQLFRALMNAAPASARRGNQVRVSLVHFGIQVQHTPPGSVELFEYRVKGCRVIGDTMAHAEGPDADQVEVPLSVIEIADVIDGVEVVLL